jgi:hypothetical protein
MATKTEPQAKIPAAEAAKLILAGNAPAGLRVAGHLKLANQPSLTSLPPGLEVTSLDLSNCPALQTLPAGLRVQRLNLSECKALSILPAGLRCHELLLRGTAVTNLPPDLSVAYRLDLSDCERLTNLPAGLKVGTLLLRNCTALTALPEGLDVCFLDISGCTRLTEWRKQGSLRFGRFIARGCWQLTSLPAWLSELSQFDVAGCAGLSQLPEGLQITTWLELADTQITTLPRSLQDVPLRWLGVPVDQRIAFHPETITVNEILDEVNMERRRVLLGRMGYDAFLTQAEAKVLDRDRDPGGERRLLRLPLPGEEDLVCVAVSCPSTGRHYMIRVPPTMKSCHQAVAWIAGFDDPAAYRPFVET